MSKTLKVLKELALRDHEVTLTEDHIASGTKFSELGIDSLDSIEMMVSLEDELDIELNNDRLEGIENIAQLVEYLREFD
mgnify:FL=1